MTTHIPIYAKAIDGVLLDACGDPVTGADSYFALVNESGDSENFIRCVLTPRYFTPGDVTVENGVGKRRVNIEGVPRLEGYDVRLELAGLSPQIEAAMFGDTLLTTPTGLKAGERTTAPPGMALRLWQDVENAACSGAVPGIKHWLSRVDRWRRGGEYRLENGASAFVIEGKAQKNPNFGRGPFQDLAVGDAFSADEFYAYDLVADISASLPTDTGAAMNAWPIV